MKFKTLIFATIPCLFLLNCSSSGGDDLSETPNPDPDPTNNNVTYNGSIKAIIDNNCIRCHGSTPTSGAPTSYTTYTQVKNSVDGILNRINNTSSPMPPSGLMATGNRDLIQQWKDDGLLEN